jgi:hypothetical protein
VISLTAKQTGVDYEKRKAQLDSVSVGFSVGVFLARPKGGPSAKQARAGDQRIVLRSTFSNGAEVVRYNVNVCWVETWTIYD